MGKTSFLSCRNFNKSGMTFLKTVKPMLSDLNTYLIKVIYLKESVASNNAADLVFLLFHCHFLLSDNALFWSVPCSCGCCCLCWKSIVKYISILLFQLQAIPDTKLTITKYADAKFEYLV